MSFTMHKMKQRYKERHFFSHSWKTVEKYQFDSAPIILGEK